MAVLGGRDLIQVAVIADHGVSVTTPHVHAARAPTISWQWQQSQGGWVRLLHLQHARASPGSCHSPGCSYSHVMERASAADYTISQHPRPGGWGVNPPWLTDRLTDWLADWIDEWMAGCQADWRAEYIDGCLAVRLADCQTGWLNRWLADWLSGWLSGCLHGWLTDYI